MREVDRLATPGHVIVARFNAVTWVGVLALALLGASLVRDFYGNSVGLAHKLAMADTAPPTFWESLRTDPFNAIKSKMTGVLARSEPPRPVLDAMVMSTINPMPGAPIPPEKLTGMADLNGYVQQVISALNTTGKLEDPCEPLTDLRKPWVDANGTANAPLCLISNTGDTIWMASIVNTSANTFAVPNPWLGVFHRVNGKWSYSNVQHLITTRFSAALPGYPNVTPDLIPYQIAKDFPYLVMEGNSHE